MVRISLTPKCLKLPAAVLAPTTFSIASDRGGSTLTAHQLTPRFDSGSVACFGVSDDPFYVKGTRSPCRRPSAAFPHIGQDGEPASPRSPGGYKPWGPRIGASPSSSSRGRSPPSDVEGCALDPGSRSKSGSHLGRHCRGDIDHAPDMQSRRMESGLSLPLNPSKESEASTSVDNSCSPSLRDRRRVALTFGPHTQTASSREETSDSSEVQAARPLELGSRPRTTMRKGGAIERGPEYMQPAVPRESIKRKSSRREEESSASTSVEHSWSPSLRNRRGVTLTLGPQTQTSSREEMSDSNEEQAAPSLQIKPRSKPILRKVGSIVCGPEHLQPAVRLVSSERKTLCQEQDWEVTVLPVPRPLPGAFGTRRTVFFFDWDDTLCPTTWIRSILKGTIADMQEWEEGPGAGSSEFDWIDGIPSWFNHPLPDLPAVREATASLQKAVMHVINAAQAYGVICIVTNAVPGWVEKTIHKWLPELRQYIGGHGLRPPIRVIYGQEAYAARRSKLDLPWVDELGEHMWWKQAAMVSALDQVDRMYRFERDCGETSYGHCAAAVNKCSAQTRASPPAISWCATAATKSLRNIVSVGDNEAEMQSAQLVSSGFKRRRNLQAAATARGQPTQRPKARSSSMPAEDGRNGRPWMKLVKFRECPHVQQLIVELEEMVEILPQVVAMRENIRLGLGQDEPPSPAHACAARSATDLLHAIGCDHEDSRVQRHLMVQTV